MRNQRVSVLGSLCTLLTVVMALAWIFPIYWIIVTSLKTEDQTIQLPPSLIPWPPNFDAFVYIFQNSPFVRWYPNTIFVSVVVTFFSILFALMCAYTLSRLEFPAKRTIYCSLLSAFLFPFPSAS